MQIYEYEEIDSTSTKCREHLRAGEKAPFAVVARRQSGGRGRMGRQWQSPDGGLYISFALPALSNRVELAGTHALVAAMILSDFLHRYMGIRPTIKWPNDILWQGKKLAGILGEQVEGHVVMGVGLNVNTPVPISGSRETITLREICQKETDLAHLTQAFASFWHSQWRLEWLDKLPERFATYPQVDVWKKEESFLSTVGVEENGALLCQNLSSYQVSRFFSVDHDLCPLSSEELSSRFLWLDIGNSRVKLARFDQQQWISEQISFDHPHWLDKLKEHIANFKNQASILGIYGLSVQAEKKVQIEAMLAPDTVFWLRRAWRHLRSDYDVQQIGLDRLALLEGAWQTYGLQKQALVVVSLGTATTIDVLVGSHHKGGWILPGLALSLHSLAELSLLPKLSWEDLQEADPKLGLSTQQAIGGGVIEQTRALLLHTQREWASKLHCSESEVQILMAGGGANLMQSKMPQALVHESMLWTGMRALLT